MRAVFHCARARALSHDQSKQYLLHVGNCVSSLDEDMLIYWCLMDGVFDCISFVRVCALEMDAKRHGKYLGSTVTVLYGPSVLRDFVRLFTSARG